MPPSVHRSSSRTMFVPKSESGPHLSAHSAHSAFSALTHGLRSKWTYLSCIIPNIGDELSPLDNVLRSKLHPALTGRPPPNNLEFALFALPARLGGLGIRIPSKAANSELQAHLCSLPLPSQITSSAKTLSTATKSLPTSCKARPLSPRKTGR